MPEKLNYGEMYVFPCSKREGSFIAQIPTIWSSNPILKKYFGAVEHKYPKLKARAFVSEFLRQYYGKERAAYIESIPQYVRKMHFGNQVSYRVTKKVSRGVRYPCFDISFNRVVITDSLGVVSKRVRYSRLFNSTNKKEVEHSVTLQVAKIRAEVCFSELHHSALEFEYDLNA